MLAAPSQQRRKKKAPEIARIQCLSRRMGNRACKCSQAPAQPKVGREHMLPCTLVTQTHFLALLLNLEKRSNFYDKDCVWGAQGCFSKDKTELLKCPFPLLGEGLCWFQRSPPASLLTTHFSLLSAVSVSSPPVEEMVLIFFLFLLFLPKYLSAKMKSISNVSKICLNSYSLSRAALCAKKKTRA